jgi:hypothetical protein
MCLVDLGGERIIFDFHLTKRRIYGIFPVKKTPDFLMHR